MHVLTDDELLPRVKQATGDVVVVSPTCVHLPRSGIWARSRTRGRASRHTGLLAAAITSKLNIQQTLYTISTHTESARTHAHTHAHTHQTNVKYKHSEPTE